jgi:excisionase family DNA binding protein
MHDNYSNSMDSLGEDLLNDTQAARRINCSKRKLHYEKDAGRIPYVRIGRLVRFIPADIAAYIQARRIG